MEAGMPGGGPSSGVALDPQTPRDTALAIINLQTFAGSWTANDLEYLMRLMGMGNLSSLISGTAGHSPEALLTAIVVRFLEKRIAGEKDIWELVVDKARAWIQTEVLDEEVAKQLWMQAEQAFH